MKPGFPLSSKTNTAEFQFYLESVYIDTEIKGFILFIFFLSFLLCLSLGVCAREKLIALFYNAMYSSGP